MTERRRKPAPPTEPLLYDIDQTCADFGGLGRTKIYAEMAAGELEYIQIGDRRFTTAEQRRAYIQRRTQRQTPSQAA
ncbi:MAG: hypothetical protein ACREJ5_04310 [Geminicoccaceae bacterium]